jgi:hypothetical protein
MPELDEEFEETHLESRTTSGYSPHNLRMSLFNHPQLDCVHGRHKSPDTSSIIIIRWQVHE